jgi:hypothetical protein
MRTDVNLKFADQVRSLAGMCILKTGRDLSGERPTMSEAGEKSLVGDSESVNMYAAWVRWSSTNLPSIVDTPNNFSSIDARLVAAEQQGMVITPGLLTARTEHDQMIIEAIRRFREREERIEASENAMHAVQGMPSDVEGILRGRTNDSLSNPNPSFDFGPTLPRESEGENVEMSEDPEPSSDYGPTAGTSFDLGRTWSSGSEGENVEMSEDPSELNSFLNNPGNITGIPVLDDSDMDWSGLTGGSISKKSKRKTRKKLNKKSKRKTKRKLNKKSKRKSTRKSSRKIKRKSTRKSVRKTKKRSKKLSRKLN